MLDSILVRYSEIAIKSKPVRSRFENILVENIHRAMKEKGIVFKVKRRRGRIIVETSNIKAACETLDHVFGIVSFSPAKNVPLENLEKFVGENVDVLVNNEPFAVRVKRTGKHDFTSQEMAKKIGALVVEKTSKKVDLTKPESILYIEIRNNHAYIYNDVLPGPMGMPLNSQGKAYCFIEDEMGILACWLVMKRGCKPIIYHTIPVDMIEVWAPGVEIEKREVGSIEEVANAVDGEELPVVLGETLENTDLEGMRDSQRKFYSVLRPLIGHNSEMLRKLGKKVKR